MEREILLDLFEGEVAELFEAASSRSASLTAVAPACAPMTALDVISHLGTIYTGVRLWVSDGRRPFPWPEPPEDADIVTWATSAAHTLIDTFLPRKAPAPGATWNAADRTNGFWFRRMAHETAVHRVDVMQALRLPWTVDESIALDGIDEAIQVFLGTQLGTEVQGSGRTVQLTNSDRDRLIRPMPGLIDYPQAGPVDAAVGGDDAAIWAWVWGRSDPDHPVEISGDPDAADELRRLFARSQQ